MSSQVAGLDDFPIEAIRHMLEEEYRSHPGHQGPVRLEGDMGPWCLFVVSPGAGVLPDSWEELNGVRVLMLHRSVVPPRKARGAGKPGSGRKGA